MTATNYEQITEATKHFILGLTKESEGHLSENNQSYFDQAIGALPLWLSLAGEDMRPADKEAIQLLIDDMPGVDDDGEGNWESSPIVHM